MTIKEAVMQRHMVRKYIDKTISAETVKQLNERIEKSNTEYDISMKLVTGNADGIGGLAKLLLTRSVYNYIILAGKDHATLDEKLGYCGADLILYAQTLGLNTWWCGGMFSSKAARKQLQNADVRVNGVIAIGYGQTQGVPHKSKPAEAVAKDFGAAPEWFRRGIDAALLAPTAVNQQKFTFTLENGRVRAKAGAGFYANVDLGIVKYHFETAAGKENFQWQ